MKFNKVIALFLIGMCSILNTNAQSKVANINSSELVQSMPALDSINKKMESIQVEYRDYIEGLQKDLQEKYQKYLADTGANPAIKERRLTELQELDAKIKSETEKAQEEIQKQQAALYEPLMKRAKAAITKVAKAKGYEYVLDTTEGGGVIMADPKHDIMADVKLELKIK